MDGQNPIRDQMGHPATIIIQGVLHCVPPIDEYEA